jgi:hypothetical protein
LKQPLDRARDESRHVMLLQRRVSFGMVRRAGVPGRQMHGEWLDRIAFLGVSKQRRT